ncbi:hypothetical protein ACFXHA_06740 [Nocardia sp. NPDC059240]|uniref:DUF7373 family lipoprotein n=1 Tax=Nocardia sp. NPDC059240 TaxID=3346786 RepID=UPI00368732BC
MGNYTGRLRSAGVLLRATAAATLAFCALASSGCGSESRAAEAKPLDLSKLDVGSYPTKPQDPTSTDPATRGRVIEALRLADAMPLAFEIDPALTEYVGGTHVFLKANSFAGYLNVDHFDSDTTGFISGFAAAAASSRESGHYSLNNSVMIFDSDLAATNAAAALARSGLNLSSAKSAGIQPDSVPLQSNQHPAAQIVWSAHEQTFASWYPTGRYIIFTLILQPESSYLQNYWNAAPDPAPFALADKAIDVTAGRLKSFQPTPPDKLAGLPLDPDGMLRLTLPRPEGDQTANAFTGTLDAHGALYDEDDPVKRALFDKTGVDNVSYGAGQLIRTRDADSAQSYFDAAFADRYHRPIDAPPGIPNARCVKYHGPDTHQFPFTCHVTFGRYVASVWSQQQQDVYQRISAQYAILANDK